MGSITAEDVDRLAREAGLVLSPGELQTLAPVVARTLELVGRLESLPLASTEPATQYRIL